MNSNYNTNYTKEQIEAILGIIKNVLKTITTPLHRMKNVKKTLN